MSLEEHLLGDPDDLRRILEALDDRNNALDRHAEEMQRNTAGVEALSQVIAANTAEVQALRVDVLSRPSTLEMDYRRRRVVAGMILFGLVSMFAVDQHTEHCGPGARAELLVDALARGVADPHAFRDLAQPRETPSCDLTAPLHTHSHKPWPSRWNLVGMGIYAAMLGALAGWLRAARRRVKAEGKPR